MRVDPMTMARARMALREAISGYLFDPNVGLIDFGYPEHDGQIATDELAIRIHVKKKLSGVALEAAFESSYTRPIPLSIGGFQVDVPEGVYRPHMWPWRSGWRRLPATNPRASRADPMRGGISISDERHNAFATLGCKVIDRTTRAEMILSNWHVLVGDWSARPGQRIYQPGRLDGGTFSDTVATLTRDAMTVNLDAAVAALNGSRRLINDQLGLGPITGVGRAILGMEMVKCGRRTDITQGMVTAIEGTARINYGSVDRVIRDVVTIEPVNSGEVSAAGDSGSMWCQSDTMEAIGLHFAGSDSPERGLALDTQSVLDALNVDIATGREEVVGAPQIRRMPRPRLVPGFGVRAASAATRAPQREAEEAELGQQ